MDEKVLEELVKTRNELKRKFQSMKADREIKIRHLEDTFKPITEPLKEFIDQSDNSKISKIIKDEVKNEIANYSNSLINQLPMKFETSTPIKDENKDSYDVLEKSLDETSNADFYSQGNTEENSDSNNTINLIDLSELGRIDLLDTLYGPHKDLDGHWKFGDSDIYLSKDKIEIANQKWSLTPGLFELMFYKLPRNYDKTELEIYKKILMNTNAHKRDYKSDGQIKGTKAYKYQTIIKKLFNVKSHPTRVNLSTTLYQGSGMKNHNIEETNYVYWNDPNEIVDRLRLLMASQAAGHNNHQNEITAIIEALRNADIIV